LVQAGSHDRRGGHPRHLHTRAAVREIIARIAIEPWDGEACLAEVHVDLCLDGGRRVRARRDDCLRVEFDPTSAVSLKSAAVSAVRRHIRQALADGSATQWSAFSALGRFGAAWEPGQADDVQISIDASEPAAVENAA
jgi:hypothetical protein